jgi:ribonuclease HI
MRNKSPKVLFVHFDGGCWPNPGGVATAGWIAFDSDGEVLWDGSEVVCEGDGATNNVAEYAALELALQWIASCDIPDASEVIIRGDSQLVIRQLEGTWKCRQPHLAAARDRCRELVASLRTCRGLKIRLEWMPRSENEIADELSQHAYEQHTGQLIPL